jgi:DNA-directed RNA polymerase II subunit RPB1
MWAEYQDDKFPEPAILKPKPLWTGKQIFSLIIPKISLERTGNKETWACPNDKNILIKNGELLCGNLTKSTIGSSSGGIIHIIWKEKGPYPTRDFMSNTQLLINNWLHQVGFTVGVQDIIAKKVTLDTIKDNLKKKNKEVKKILHDAQTGNLKT